MSILKNITFIKQKSYNLRNDYKFMAKLGSGAQSLIYLVEHKVTGEKRVVKKVLKSKIKSQSEGEIRANEI